MPAWRLWTVLTGVFLFHLLGHLECEVSKLWMFTGVIEGGVLLKSITSSFVLLAFMRRWFGSHQLTKSLMTPPSRIPVRFPPTPGQWRRRLRTSGDGQKEVKVRRGEDATLECYGRSGATDILLRWTKDDQQIEGYVIYFKDGRFQEHNQDHSFKGRVEMKDSKWMKNGNFSVILQNVTMKDSGTYKCEAAYNNQKPRPLNSTSLKVEQRDNTGERREDKGKENGSVGPVPQFLLCLLLLLLLVL